MIEALHDVVEGRFPVTCPVTLLKSSLALASRAIDSYPLMAAASASVMVLLSLAAVVLGALRLWA